MKSKRKVVGPRVSRAEQNVQPSLPGYPDYPASEDIFRAAREVMALNPEDFGQRTGPGGSGRPGKNNEKSFAEDPSGSDLDVPGSELDDEQESVGSEDEENNFYSIGGDDHANLEEDQGA